MCIEAGGGDGGVSFGLVGHAGRLAKEAWHCKQCKASNQVSAVCLYAAHGSYYANKRSLVPRISI